jgi:hypothetical protein
MEPDQFIDIVNNNSIQHYATHEAFKDVTFAAFQAQDNGDTVIVSGAWINTVYNCPTDKCYETIFIKKEDLSKWNLQPSYPGKKDA